MGKRKTAPPSLKKPSSQVAGPPLPHLHQCLQWAEAVIRARLSAHFNGGASAEAIFEAGPPPPGRSMSAYAQFLRRYQPDTREQFLLLLALMPHFYPSLLETLVHEQVQASGDYPQIGFTRGQAFRGFLPTGETAVFLLAGDSLEKRIEVEQLFSVGNWFHQNRVLWLEAVPEGEPVMSGRIVLNPELIEYFKTGKVSPPTLSTDFPAQYIDTQLEWGDLVLPESTMTQIDELRRWVEHHPRLMNDWGMDRKLKPGYRALFYGPAGTGKTLTASLLGKNTGRDVFRIDLSMVVSKYIGETEKNLSRLFARAQNKDWILFFDEADALFGKRTDVRDAHDKYANQEVAYLLQRIENYPGLAILASNFKSNIDEAFTRRFQSIIYFPKPKAPERLLLWQKAFPSNVTFSPEADFNHIAQRYELSGSNIMNIVQYTCLYALDQNSNTITLEMIREGIEREMEKEGKII
ncbi:MAG: ATP-binding protein [Phaeodactylibacter sp.]|nr:ATP-binding protein [Phaeodactylibacter sp.]